MFIILEWNGMLPNGWIGATIGIRGQLRIWKTRQAAVNWGKKNCAFNWKVVEL